jgi:hypothetical protein
LSETGFAARDYRLHAQENHREYFVAAFINRVL